MKFSVSSGNSLDTLYFSADGVPAQQPGLKTMKEKKEKVIDQLTKQLLKFKDLIKPFSLVECLQCM